jgi:SAM-dependent methyltransferase
MPEHSIEESVASVGKGWGDAAWAETYYAMAETQTDFFWNRAGLFRPLFDRLDLTSVIELACGRGRHAEIVAPLAQRLVVMDIHAINIEACRRRLGHHPHLVFRQNSGFDFTPELDHGTTAIYCYDAMVHFSPDIVQAYLRDTARVLAPGGMAFYHHSNYPAPPDRPYGSNPGARNHMTAEMFASYARSAGLDILVQQVIEWDKVPNLDCLTLVQRLG